METSFKLDTFQQGAMGSWKSASEGLTYPSSSKEYQPRKENSISKQDNMVDLWNKAQPQEKETLENE